MAEIPPIKLPGKLQTFAPDDVALLGGLRRSAGEMTFQDPIANGGAAVTLAQLLSGVGGATWTSLSDTPGTIQADQVVFGNAAGLQLAFRGPTFANIKASEPVVTGVINPGDLELSVFSPTQVQVASGLLGIADRVTSLNVKEFQSNLAAPLQVTPVGIGSRASFWTASDAGKTGLVTIKEYSAHPTVADLRTESLLGVSLHSGSVVLDVVNTPDIYRDQGQAVNDLWRPVDADGLPVQAGTGVASEIDATLRISTTNMVLESRGIGFHGSSGVDPNHSAPIVGQNPFSFATIQGDGTVFNTGVLDFPKTWNDGGVETALTGNRAVVHQVAWLADGEGIVQLGTTNYQNYDAAISAITQERITNPLWDIAREFGASIGIVVISNNATTTWADGIAHLFPMQGGQVTVGGVTNYLALTDTPNDRAGRVGQVPSINATEDADVYGKIRAKYDFGFPGNLAGAPLVNIALPTTINAFKFHIDNVKLKVKTAESVTPVIIDVNLAGTTIFPGAKPTLDTGIFESDQAVSPDAIAAKGIALTVDLDNGGTVWRDLTVAVEGWIEPG